MAVVQRKMAHLRSELADLFEFPKDILMDLPRITLLGNMRLVMENHRGLIHYSPTKMRICLEKGELVLEGTELAISLISPEEIVVEGNLQGLQFCD